ncbi:phage minor capsid protein [Micromonospora sp. NPDC048930]|uniref:phage minor capsid protein n=1 Tax=Micromonospora sp. NPDC048930 TaxID=3364261 RepID=UPI00371A83E0
MALTGDQIEAIARSTVDLYRTAEQAILREVTRKLAAGMDAPDWAVTRLGALSTLRRTVERILAVVEADGADQIREALARAYRSGQAAATTGLPAQLLPRDPDAVRAAGIVAQEVTRAGVIENLAAALVQDVGERHSNVLRHVLDVYRTVVQQATAVSVAGGMTRRQASQFAYQRFIDQGVSSFTDSRGRVWRLSSYVEMAVRTVTQRAAVQGQTDRLQTLGLDLVIVSNSPRECPKCRPWEGKVLSTSGRQRGRVELDSMVGSGTVTVDIAGTVDEARADGLQHPNCTHSLRAYLPGATKRPAGQLANPKGYEAKDRQRAIERQIRRWKEREAGALDDSAKATAAAKVRQWQATMRDHLAANPELKRLPYREAIGAGNLPR